jgi:quinohemoprotein amine dehydrogenase
MNGGVMFPLSSLPLRLALVCSLILSASVLGQPIPVTDDLVVAKCGNCHTRDAAGIMQRISWERSTPEGWQDVLKRMFVVNNISVTPLEARSILKYLSTKHGLAPEEAKSVLYDVERRVHEETAVLDRTVVSACTNCHNLARPLSWRRSADDWKQFGVEHVRRFGLKAGDEVFTYFAKAAPLSTPEWTEWSSKPRPANLAGRWLLTATLPGCGRYTGEMQVQLSSEDEFTTSIRMTSVEDGSVILRSGRSAVYGGYAWRGRSSGNQDKAPVGGPSSDAREVMWFAPGQASGQGRWFWGQYQEFGFDVQLRRPVAGPTLLSLGPTALKAGSATRRVRLVGDKFPAKVALADFDLGSGVTVEKIVSSTSGDVVLEVAIAADVRLGKRDIRFAGSSLAAALTIYDRVDYIAVRPDTTLAAFADKTHPPGYQQFAATAYQRGADNKIHTADDLDLGPIGVTWSIDVFYDTDGTRSKLVGEIDAAGLFTPASKNPEQNFDVWAVATATGEVGTNGQPLVGKSYLVVTVPTYTFNGRRYVRDLGRWVDDGAATP